MLAVPVDRKMFGGGLSEWGLSVAETDLDLTLSKCAGRGKSSLGAPARHQEHAWPRVLSSPSP